MSVIRPLRPSELAAATDLCLRSKAQWGYDADFMAKCVDELTLTSDDLANTDLAALDVDGVLVGVVQISWDHRYPELEKLFVDPGQMGKGYGSLLLNWAFDRVRQKGHSRLMIASDPGAEAFYTKFGAARHGFMASGSIPDRDLPWLAIDV